MTKHTEINILRHPASLVICTRRPDGSERVEKLLACHCTSPVDAFDFVVSLHRDYAKAERAHFVLHTYDETGGNVDREEIKPARRPYRVRARRSRRGRVAV